MMRDRSEDPRLPSRAEVEARRIEAQLERAERDLDRYQALMVQGRATLREKFVVKELAALVDVFNGHWFAQPSAIAGEALVAEVEDAIHLNGLDQKWELSGPALLYTLRGLSALEAMALADAVERWWARVGAGEQDLEPAALLDD